MAVSFQQQALVRKLAYSGLIVILFTVSLLHRRLVVEAQGNELLLREVSKGEVKLTDSAVRLALTGSRGLAVTFLWQAAIEKQKKHEWNELDLLVSSITKLQPHFITPWLFQSWNLAFNVAVECDRPKDKYYYISRGLEVLAEGERRNFKPPAPGNPDMRQNMGFYYQLKIGSSDEKTTMRCLLEMSCIDPLARDPRRLLEPDRGRGKKVKLDKFKQFCTDHPRLVRRLHEHLKYATPESIVDFLEDNKDVPSRFEPPTGGSQQQESALKDELEQFPILPPGRLNLKNRELSSSELVDVFFVSRNWFEYAQEPLPDPNPNPAIDPPPPNPLVKRNPRYIAIQIFRTFPARAQAYIAENMETEGWFDSDGWVIKKWFDEQRGANEPEPRVGTEPKYHAGPAWESAHLKYLEFATRNGLYLTPPQEAKLTADAVPYRKTFKVDEGAGGLEIRPGSPLYDSFLAHKRLSFTGLYSSMTNYLEYLVQSDAERHPETVTARKLLYQAERLRRLEEDAEGAIAKYQAAWQLWPHVLLAYPKFARLSTVQEELYEKQFSSNGYMQRHRPELFKPLVIGVAQLGIRPHPNFANGKAQAENWISPAHLIARNLDGLAPAQGPVGELAQRLIGIKDAEMFAGSAWLIDVDKVLNSSQKLKITPIRNHRGILDDTLYYDGPQAAELKLALAAWPQAAIKGWHFFNPALVPFELTRPLARGSALPPNWHTFVDQDAINRVRQRFGLDRAEKAEQKERTK